MKLEKEEWIEFEDGSRELWFEISEPSWPGFTDGEGEEVTNNYKELELPIPWQGPEPVAYEVFVSDRWLKAHPEECIDSIIELLNSRHPEHKFAADREAALRGYWFVGWPKEGEWMIPGEWK